MTAVICYASYSGNTQEVAQLIAETIIASGREVVLHRIDGRTPPPNLAKFDIVLIGSFTWGKGETPRIVKNWVADVGYKPDNVYIFGTGDTQFGGDELFCKAADKLAKFYNSDFPPLKIEQSPRGAQENKVREWTKGVLRIEKRHLKQG